LRGRLVQRGDRAAPDNSLGEERRRGGERPVFAVTKRSACQRMRNEKRTMLHRLIRGGERIPLPRATQNKKKKGQILHAFYTKEKLLSITGKQGGKEMIPDPVVRTPRNFERGKGLKKKIYNS